MKQVRNIDMESSEHVTLKPGESVEYKLDMQEGNILRLKLVSDVDVIWDFFKEGEARNPKFGILSGTYLNKAYLIKNNGPFWFKIFSIAFIKNAEIDTTIECIGNPVEVEA